MRRWERGGGGGGGGGRSTEQSRHLRLTLFHVFSHGEEREEEGGFFFKKGRGKVEKKFFY